MVEAIKDFFVSRFSPEWAVFFTSMVPIIECRGAIPLGVALLGAGSYLKVFLIAVLGNIIPVPFILWFIRPVIAWLKKTKLLHGVAEWIENKAEKNKAKIQKYEKFGLYVFVAIPLPGTGAWTGALVAAMLEMRIKDALPMILAGVATASVIMMIISYGASWIINIF